MLCLQPRKFELFSQFVNLTISFTYQKSLLLIEDFVWIEGTAKVEQKKKKKRKRKRKTNLSLMFVI